MDALGFIYSQLFVPLPYPTRDFFDQTIIVTGSNVGLGLEAARHFTRLNAQKVILAVRNIEKGDAAKKSIEGSTKRTGVVEVWQLDLSSYESVKQFATKAQSLQRLDVLVENAGVATNKWLMAEGQERTITVNVISTFLLALMILPKLRETAMKFNTLPHMVIVSSEVHFFAKFSERNEPKILDALADKGRADMSDRYNVSKLLEVLYIRALVSRLKDSKRPEVVVNYLTPGLCHSELGRDVGAFLGWIKFFFARTTEMGSRSLVHAAQADEETNGQFLLNCGIANPSSFVMSADGEEAQEKVFKEVSEKLEAIQPGIMSIEGLDV